MPHADARILIVDGHVAVARLVARIVGAAGLRNTEIAFDTPTARERLQASAPDVVILDAHIAPMAVSAFITLIRKVTDGRAVTLMMTTSRTDKIVETAREAGAHGILLKPFTPGDLRAELTSASEKKSSSSTRGPARPDQRAAIIEQSAVILD